MLAFKWQDHCHKATYPVHVQPKLDGARLLFQAGVMQSRSYGQSAPKFIHDSRLQHIRKALAHLPDSIVLDGEIYVHGWSRQKINQQFSVNSTEPRPQEHHLEYHIYDHIDLAEPDRPFHSRDFHLRLILSRLPSCIKYVPGFFASDSLEVEHYFRTFRDHGYEGAMIRDLNAPYGLSENCTNQENRWTCLLKRKEWLDETYTIVGINEEFTIDNLPKSRLGSLVLENSRDFRRFSVGSGFSDSERDSFWSSPPLGKLAHIKFDSFSDEGIPLNPVFLEVLE